MGRIITLKDHHYYGEVTPELAMEKQWARELEGQLLTREHSGAWWKRPARKLSVMFDGKSNGAVG